MEIKKFSLTQSKEIGDRLNVNWNEVNLNEFAIGLNVELEHGSRYFTLNVTNDNPILTAKIALAHLREFPDYYTRLQKMEREAKAFWSIPNAVL